MSLAILNSTSTHPSIKRKSEALLGLMNCVSPSANMGVLGGKRVTNLWCCPGGGVEGRAFVTAMDVSEWLCAKWEGSIKSVSASCNSLCGRLRIVWRLCGGAHNTQEKSATTRLCCLAPGPHNTNCQGTTRAGARQRLMCVLAAGPFG